jgi:hypothetical protein
MITLTQTTDKLVVILNAAQTSAAMKCVSSWRDIVGQNGTPGRTVVPTNGAADVTLVTAPANAPQMQRCIDYVSIYNSDTAQKTVTVKYDANATQYTLWSGPLGVGEKMEYTDGIGFQVFDANGMNKIGTTQTNTFSGTAPTSATTGTMTVSLTTPIITITPTGACTFNGTGGVINQICTFVITTSGTSSFVLTWGTNFQTTATLATGVTTAKTFQIMFVCTNGTTWREIARTAPM